MKSSNWLKGLFTGALVASLALVAGCPPPDDEDDAGTGSDASVQHDAATGNDAAGNDAGGPCPAQYQYTDWNVTSDRLLVKACSPYIIPASTEIEITNDATLTIEAGVEVRFPDSSYLRVGNSSPGQLIVNGTSSEPVVFTSSLGTPTAGAWGGILLADQTSAATVIANARIRYAGQAVNSLFQGCLTISSTNTNRITVNNTTFEDCTQAGVSAREATFGFAAFTNNSFTNCPIGMRIHPNAIGTVAGTQTYTSTPKNQIEEGIVAATAAWAKQGVVWEARGDVDVEGSDNPVLTIAAGSSFKFPVGSWFAVGQGTPGGLVVSGSASEPVVFDTSEATPAAGSWVGLVFGTETLASSSLSYVTIKYAGQPYNSLTRGCLTVLSSDPGRVAVNNTTVDTCAQSGVSAVEPGTTFASFANNTIRQAPIGLNLNAQAIGSIANSLTFVSTTVNHIRGDTVRATATWLKQSLPWNVDNSIYVDDAANPILTIAAGSEFRFSRDEYLEVGDGTGGGLIVAGTSTEPVLFTSRESSPTRGSWIGLVFGESTLATSSLSYATVRYAGQNYNSILKGCLTVQSRLTGRLAVNNSTFDTCLQAAVAVINDGFGFVSFANNHLVNSELGLRLNAQSIGSIAASNTYDASTTLNHIIGDTVISTATWLSQPVPWQVEGSLYVEHDTNNPVLTIVGPNTFRFAQSEEFGIGGGVPGGLIVNGTAGNVVFESSQPTPVAGAWIGLYFEYYALAGSVIDRATIRHAGEAFNSITLGAINLRTAQSAVTITNSTFETINQADIYVHCDTAAPVTSGNTYAGPGVVNAPNC